MAVGGLDHPSDLAAWQAWQMRQRGIKARAKDRARRLLAPHFPLTLTTTPRPGCDVLIALDATTPTAVLALLRPLTHLRELSVWIASPDSVSHLVPEGEWAEQRADIDAVPALAHRATVTLALGHYLPLGAAAFRGAKPGRFLTVQHGLITPQAPPLAAGTRVLSWSQADGDFYRSGRTDVSATVVGSQLLWEASAARVTSPPADTARPVYLGQLHGAELDRAGLAASTERFCREHHAIYRPHPAERDRRSRAWHQHFRAAGIEIDSSAVPLTELNAPVVSAFSTGILEAAARGLPAWAYHADPPPWLVEFWNRYGMHRWGDTPTPAPPQPDIEPAQAIAQVVMDAVNR